MVRTIRLIDASRLAALVLPFADESDGSRVQLGQLFGIESHKTFQNSLFFSYSRVYTLNSLLVYVLLAMFFWPRTLRTFDFSNTYAAFFYKSFIYVPLINATVLFGSLMDILISLERLFKFYPRLDTRLSQIPRWQMIATFLVVTALVCLCLLI